MKKVFLMIALTILFSSIAAAQGTGFNFQGRLNDGTNPANGQYDLQFRLYTAVTGGGQIGAVISRPATVLINGVFSTTLDFGATAFSKPNNVFIEIAVKPANSPNAYTILGPRQQLTVVPFAGRAANASNADLATNATNAQNAVNATNATTANNALNLGGVPAANYAQLNVVNTGDLRTNGALAITGNAFQPIAAKGFAKAMLVVYYDGTVRQCFNGITYSITGNCGFTVTTPLGTSAGVYRIDFGFPVTNSFVSTAAQYEDGGSGDGNNRSINYRKFNDTSIEFFIWSPVNPKDTERGVFTVIMF